MKAIAFINKDNQVTIVREGGIKAVITGMQKHADSEKVQLGGIGALWNLACKFENKVTVAREEGIGAVITVMQRHRESSCRGLGVGL